MGFARTRPHREQASQASRSTYLRSSISSRSELKNLHSFSPNNPPANPSDPARAYLDLEIFSLDLALHWESRLTETLNNESQMRILVTHGRFEIHALAAAGFQLPLGQEHD